MPSVLRRDGATTIAPSEGVDAAGLAKFFIDKVNGVRAAILKTPRLHYIVLSMDRS